MPEAGTYTPAEKLAEIERELAMRKRVYPGMIARGNLTVGQASRQLSLLRAVASDYAAIIDQTPVTETSSQGSSTLASCGRLTKVDESKPAATNGEPS